MAYCKNAGTDSDVYMLPTVHGIECCGCSLAGRYTTGLKRSKIFEKRSKALKHLKEHIKAGDRVPNYAIKRLKKEIKELGDFLPSKI